MCRLLKMNVGGRGRGGGCVYNIIISMIALLENMGGLGGLGNFTEAHSSIYLVQTHVRVSN